MLNKKNKKIKTCRGTGLVTAKSTGTGPSGTGLVLAHHRANARWVILWNQYDTVLTGHARSNNIVEGCKMLSRHYEYHVIKSVCLLLLHVFRGER